MKSTKTLSGHLGLTLILALVFIAALLSQATAQSHGRLTKLSKKEFTAGKYKEASIYAIQALRKKPSYEKAQIALEMAYPTFREFYEKDIAAELMYAKNDAAESKVRRYRRVITLYNDLIKTQNDFQALPPPLSDLKSKYPEKDYVSKIQEVQDLRNDGIRQAAEVKYQEGLKLMKKTDKRSQRSAAHAFKAANGYVPSYKDASQKYAECRQAAIVRVVVVPFEDKSNRSEFGEVGELISGNVTSKLVQDGNLREFTEFLDRDQLSMILREQGSPVDQSSAIQLGKVAKADFIIVGQVSQISTNEQEFNPTVSRVSQKVIVGYQKYINKKGKQAERPVRQDVYADLYTFKKEASATVSGSYKIIDVNTGTIVDNQQFREKYDYSYSWARFKGDERGLSSSQSALAGKQEASVPGETERVNNAADMIANKVAYGIKGRL